MSTHIFDKYTFTVDAKMNVSIDYKNNKIHLITMREDSTLHNAIITNGYVCLVEKLQDDRLVAHSMIGYLRQEDLAVSAWPAEKVVRYGDGALIWTGAELLHHDSSTRSTIEFHESIEKVKECEGGLLVVHKGSSHYLSGKNMDWVPMEVTSARRTGGVLHVTFDGSTYRREDYNFVKVDDGSLLLSRTIHVWNETKWVKHNCLVSNDTGNAAFIIYNGKTMSLNIPDYDRHERLKLWKIGNRLLVKNGSYRSQPLVSDMIILFGPLTTLVETNLITEIEKGTYVFDLLTGQIMFYENADVYAKREKITEEKATQLAEAIFSLDKENLCILMSKYLDETNGIADETIQMFKNLKS